MLSSPVNSTLRIIRTVFLNFDGAELTAVDCNGFVEQPHISNCGSLTPGDGPSVVLSPLETDHGS